MDLVIVVWGVRIEDQILFTLRLMGGNPAIIVIDPLNLQAMAVWDSGTH